MAATPKHRRSSSKRRSTRASNRYDVVLTKAKKVKKNGGKLLSAKAGKSLVPSHRVTKANPTYKGVKVFEDKE